MKYEVRSATRNIKRVNRSKSNIGVVETRARTTYYVVNTETGKRVEGCAYEFEHVADEIAASMNAKSAR